MPETIITPTSLFGMKFLLKKKAAQKSVSNEKCVFGLFIFHSFVWHKGAFDN